MRNTGLIIAVLLAAVCGAAPASGQDAVSGLRACRAETDTAARLACFDRLAARYDTAAPVAQAAPSAPPPSAGAAPPASVTGAPPAAVAQAAPAAKTDFGAEGLQRYDNTPRPEESMTAVVAKVSFNAIGHFIVALDNGQVWRQIDADTATARFRGSDTVKITKGFLDSYSLAIDGRWGSYGVKRIK